MLNLLSATISLLVFPLLLAVGDVYLDALGAELAAANVAEDGRHLIILLRASTSHFFQRGNVFAPSRSCQVTKLTSLSPLVGPFPRSEGASECTVLDRSRAESCCRR